MDPSPFSGRAALVTGGSRGIGRACALALAREGADVAISYRENERAAQGVLDAIHALGRRGLALQGDAGQTETAHAVVRRAVDEFGRLDFVVANAGAGSTTPWDHVSRTEWDRLLQLNAWSPIALAQAARPALSQRRGAIIVIASIAGIAPFPEELSYAASKAAALHVTRSLAWALAPDVRVNAIAPGWTQTDMTRGLHGDPERRARIAAGIPRGRWGRPEEIAEAVVFLASDMARFVTGETLVLDGGESILWTMGGKGEG